METLVYSAITVVILICWVLLERTIMTPYDIYRKFERDILYVAPEEVGILLAKTSRAITACEEIFDKYGPYSEAGEEAVEVLQKLRRFYKDLVIRGSAEQL
jgi:hypothetical protein